MATAFLIQAHMGLDFNLKASGGKAVSDQLKDLLKPLASTETLVAALKKSGGVFGALRGDKREYEQFQLESQGYRNELAAQQRAYEQLEATVSRGGIAPEDLQPVTEEIDQLRQGIDDTTLAIAELEQNFEKFGTTSGDKIEQTIQKMQDAREALKYSGGQMLSGAGGLLQGLGGGMGGGLGDLGDALNSVQQFQGQIGEIGGVFKNVWNSIEPGGSVLDKTKQGFTGLFQTILGGNPYMAAAGIAMAAVSLALKQVQQSAEDAKDAINKDNEKRIEQADLQRQINDAIDAGDLDTVLALQKQYSSELKKQGDIAQVSGMKVNRYVEEYNKADAATKAVLFYGGGRAIYDEQMKAYKDAQTEISKLTGNMTLLNNAIPALQVAKQVKELDDALEPLTHIDTFAEKIAAAVQDYQSATEELANLEAQHTADLQQAAEDDSWSLYKQVADRAREDSQALAEYVDQAVSAIEESKQREVDINKEYAKTLLGMAKDKAKAELDAQKQLNKSLAQLIKDLNKSRADEQAQFQEGETAAIENYRKQSLKADEQFNKEKLRRQEDLQRDLNKAERSNDVLAFIEAQEQGALDLQRMQQDHDDQQAESEAQFNDERAQAAAEHQKRLDDMARQADEQRQQLMEQFAEEQQARNEEYAERLTQEREAKDERLAQERQSLMDSLAQQREAFEKQKAAREEQRQWDDTWAAREAERTKARTEEAYAQQKQTLETKLKDDQAILEQAYARRNQLTGGSMATELAAVQQFNANLIASARQLASNVGGTAAAAGNTAAQLGYNASHAVSNWLGALGGRSKGRKSGGGLRGFAKGGVAMQPMIARLAEDEPELIIPVSKLATGGAGGKGGNTYNFHGSIANGMTRAEVNAMFKATIEGFAEIAG